MSDTSHRFDVAPPAVQLEDGAVLAKNIEFVAESTGLISGKAANIVNILGRRSLGWNSTSVFGDVANYLDTSQNLLSAVSTATTYYIRSSDGNDISGGTGARTVRIVYLDNTGAQLVTTKTMNGTTGVTLGANISAFQWMEVASLGSSETGIGNITISSVVGAPTVAQTVDLISAGGNRSLCGRYTVPTGYSAYMMDWDASGIGTATFDVRLRATQFMDDSTLSTVYHFIDTFFVTASVPGDSELHYRKLPQGATIKISCIPSASAAGNRLDAMVSLLVVAN